jgi:mannose-6-phosphate isomerase
MYIEQDAAKMYPLEFIPIAKERIWGGYKLRAEWHKDFPDAAIGESWEISGVAGAVSRVKAGDFAGETLTALLKRYGPAILGEAVFARFGTELPLLFKLIDANDKLSVQAHPDDASARARHNCMGKTEMWFVAQADAGSRLFNGFSQPLSLREYDDLVENGGIGTALAAYTVERGDVFFIPAGRVHGIGAGVVIVEIQQSSDITYRIFDYNRTDAAGAARELHTALARDIIDFSAAGAGKTPYTPQENAASAIARCDYFTVNYLWITRSITRNLRARGSFAVYMCVSGAASLVCGGKTAAMQKGSTVLVPAACSEAIALTARGGECVLLETYV